MRWSVHAAGRGAGELSEHLVGGLEWDFSCMESSAVLHACLAVSVTLGLADTQERASCETFRGCCTLMVGDCPTYLQGWAEPEALCSAK